MLLKCYTQVPGNLESSTVATGLEKVSFHSNPKEDQYQECSNYPKLYSFHIISRSWTKSSKLGYNIVCQDLQTWFRKSIGSRDQIANICWIIDKAREFKKKKSTSAYLITLKPLTVWISTNCKILKEMASSPITSRQIDGKQWKQWQTFFFWAPKSLQMVIAALK